MSPRVLFYHPESDSYIEAFGEEISEWWAKNDGLLSDVTGVESHEAEFERRKKEEA